MQTTCIIGDCAKDLIYFSGFKNVEIGKYKYLYIYVQYTIQYTILHRVETVHTTDLKICDASCDSYQRLFFFFIATTYDTLNASGRATAKTVNALGRLLIAVNNQKRNRDLCEICDFSSSPQILIKMKAYRKRKGAWRAYRVHCTMYTVHITQHWHFHHAHFEHCVSRANYVTMNWIPNIAFSSSLTQSMFS